MSSRKRSAVWNHFDEVEPKKAKCSYCSNLIAISSGNVGNLSRHLNSKHPTVPLVPQRQEQVPIPEQEVEHMNAPSTSAAAAPTAAEPAGAPQRPHFSIPVLPSAPLRRNAQPSMAQFVQNTKPLAPRRAEIIDEQLVKMIARGYHPFMIVEEPEFKKIVNMLCPGYTLPTRKTVSETLLPKMFKKEYEKAQEKIAAAPAICLTTDGWTSTYNNDSFIAVTAHYIVKDDKITRLDSTMLGCVEYTERHTAANLSEFLKKIMQEWDISHKITAIASDNAANVTASIKAGGWRQVPCFAHSLNLCVQTALGAIADTLTKVKCIVEYFKRSTQGLTKLRQMQRQMECPALKLKQDVPTRWNSTYNMLDRILKIKDAVSATLATTRPDLMLSVEDWDTITAAVPILKMFYDVTNEISAEKNVSLSKVVPLCNILSSNIRKHINAQVDQLIPSIQLMAETLKNELDRRFTYVQHHVLNTEASLLDPRFKDKGFRDKSLADKALASLKIKVGQNLQVSSRSRPPAVEPTAQESQQPSTSTSSVWEDFDREIAKQTPANPTAAGIVEVEKYLQEPMIPRTSDPLMWWHERRNIYPMLYDYIQRRLNIVATSVPCERIFSKAGYTLTERRTRPASKKLQELLFINCNAQ